MFIEIRSHGPKVDGQKLGTLLILLGTPARASDVVCTSMQVNAAQELQASVISDIKNMVSVIFSKTAFHGFRTLFIQFFSIISLALTDTICFLSVHCTPDSSFQVNKLIVNKAGSGTCTKSLHVSDSVMFYKVRLENLILLT